NHAEDTVLYVYALSGPDYGVVVELGSVSGSAADGWRSAELDVRAFRGQSIRLRFRTYWGSSSRNDKSRVDNVALAVELPGWEPSPLGYAWTSDQDWPEDPGLTEPDNLLFEQGTTLLPSATYPPNYDFDRGREMSDESTYPLNYDLGSGDLGNWEASDLAYVEVRDDGFSLDGPYLYLGRYGHWAATYPFTVPVDAQSMHFDYTSWSDRNHAESAALYVYALSGPDYSVVVELGSYSGSLKDGWRKAVLDLQAYRGQSIRLRFRTYWGSSSRNDKARVDNVRLAVEVPDWQASDIVYRHVAGCALAPCPARHQFYLGRYGYWAASEPILIPEDAQSLRFDYMNWADRNHAEDTVLYVYALSGPDYGVV
ncbi:MAG: hypothetical protein GY835_01370, partial [bacterium]|nr:hypothetical protein [bacterium]